MRNFIPNICYSTCFLLLSATKVLAQESLTTGGANVAGSSGSISYSIGQLHFESTESLTGSVSAGVQQPIEIYKLGSIVGDKLPVSIYPNPASSFIHLELGSRPPKELICQLFDMSGKLLSSEQITRQQTRISLETLPGGTYMLTVQESQSQIMLQTFKIIKNL